MAKFQVRVNVGIDEPTLDHILRLDDKYWWDVENGIKTAEIRFNDRGYKVNDIVAFRSLDGQHFIPSFYVINHVTDLADICVDGGYPFDGWVMFSFVPVREDKDA